MIRPAGPQLEERFNAVRSPIRTAEAFGIEEIIDPRDTRPLLVDWVRLAYANIVPTHSASARGRSGPSSSRVQKPLRKAEEVAQWFFRTLLSALDPKAHLGEVNHDLAERRLLALDRDFVRR